MRSGRRSNEAPEIRAKSFGDTGQGTHRGVHRTGLKPLPALGVYARGVGGILLREASRDSDLPDPVAKLALNVLDNLATHRISIRCPASVQTPHYNTALLMIASSPWGA